MQPDIIHSAEIVEPDFAMVPKYILKVHTDTGIVGVGETYGGENGARLRENAAAFQGKNILDMDLAKLSMPNGAGYGAFETAFYDIVGKAFGWPVYRLLGGLAQPKVLVGYWCGRKNAKDMRTVADVKELRRSLRKFADILRIAEVRRGVVDHIGDRGGRTPRRQRDLRQARQGGLPILARLRETGRRAHRSAAKELPAFHHPPILLPRL